MRKPNFDAIRAYYAKHMPAIMAARRNEWGIYAYQWEEEQILSMTFIEFCLWQDIRRNGLVLYPQFPVGRFFVDFGNPVAQVAIECDGAQFHMDAAKDAARQREIERMGWTVYRLTGSECVKDMDDETREPSYAAKLCRNIGAAFGISDR